MWGDISEPEQAAAVLISVILQLIEQSFLFDTEDGKKNQPTTKKKNQPTKNKTSYGAERIMLAKLYRLLETTTKKYGTFLQKLSSCLEKVNNEILNISRNRKPLQLDILVREQRGATSSLAPKMIKTHRPVFDEEVRVLGPRGNNQLSATEKEMQTLRKKLRRERRGAIRELRRDAAFISVVQAKERDVRGAEQDRKIKHAMTFLENQQATFNQAARKEVSSFEVEEAMQTTRERDRWK